MFATSIFIISDPLKRKPAVKVTNDHAPTIDVLVPSYNESMDIVAVTLVAAKAMTYPEGKLNVYLLDDGGTDEKCDSDDDAVAAQARRRRASFQKLCVEIGVNYLTRERNVRAKAGNLNAALQHVTGDLVAVFDADHAPARDFLQKTVGFFTEDERLFLVQTPHKFLNPDPLERNLETFMKMPSESEMFYGDVQRGLDKWNSAFFCGSAAVLRRAALDEIGGFSGTTITEDAETALDLHSRGWNSVYVDEPLIAGLQPETFDAFIGQRSRWCCGMTQILLLKNPIFTKGLNIAQRISYSSSVLFWLFPFPRLIFMFAPLAFIFFNMKIYVATQQEFVAYTATYMLAAVLIQNYIHGRTRWPWISELYEYIQSVYLLRSVFRVFFSPNSPTFNVTRKGVVLEKDRLSHLAVPYFLIFAVLLIAMVVVVERFNTEPGSRDILLAIGFWNAFNLTMAGVALGVVAERRERRKAQRVPVSRKARLELGDVKLDIVIENLSFGGINVRVTNLAAHASVPRIAARTAGRVYLDLPGRSEELEVPIVVASGKGNGGGRTFGLRFLGDDAAQYTLISEVLFANLAAVHRRRAAPRRAPGVLLGSINFIVWGFTQTWRGFSYALFKRQRKVRRPVEVDEVMDVQLSPAE